MKNNPLTRAEQRLGARVVSLAIRANPRLLRTIFSQNKDLTLYLWQDDKWIPVGPHLNVVKKTRKSRRKVLQS
nr:MAG TPA: hypothetical protein [Caudoviricetes sp.]